MHSELATIFDRNTGFREKKKREKKKETVQLLTEKYGHIQNRNFSSFQYDRMWPVNMTSKANIWPVKPLIRLDIVRWPAIISSPKLVVKYLLIS